MAGKWLCDICKKRRFDTLEEATRHEATCQVHPFFQANKKQRITIDSCITVGARKKPTEAALAQPKIPINAKLAHPFFTKSSAKAAIHVEKLNVENVDEATRLGQQRALEFFSKQKESRTKSVGTGSLSRKHQTTLKTRIRPKASLAPRFPVPNHLIVPPPIGQHAENDLASSKGISFPQRLTETVEPFSASKENNVKVWLTDLPTAPSAEPDVLLAQAIAECMTPPGTTVCRDLVERYYNQGCFIASESVRDELKSFIERFKIERLHAQNRMRERHDRKKATRRKAMTKIKRREPTHESDDDLWEDDDELLAARTTLCLLSGPSGCGKSSLVYRMAELMECHSVLELHPGELRSGMQLRKFLEEATKSHSTKDMIQEKHAFSAKQKELVDSDDSEPEEAARAKGASVTIILVDEVDTLFPSDAGFWPALSDMAKTSKCPIILTSNYSMLPDDLKSPYTHIRLDRPSVKDFVSKLTQIASAEGFKCHRDLEKVAILGGCDMRRILYAMHAYALAPIPTAAFVSDDEDSCVAVERPKSRTMYIEERAPIVEGVEPFSILADEITCLTIHGKNFTDLASASSTSQSVDVFVGDQICPFTKVLDDKTILSVCQPRCVPPVLDCQGYFKGSRRRSLVTAYQPVIVQLYARRGLSNSSATVCASALANETRLLSHPKPILVDVQFHGYRKESSALVESSDDENELTVNAAAPIKVVFDEVSHDLLDKCLSVFNDALAKREATYEITMSTPDPTDPCEVDFMEDVALDCQFASDAAFFDDVGLRSIPYLSGPCRGFGFTMTTEYRSRTNENSKSPGYQRLFEECWNEDYFFFGTSDTYVQEPSRFGIERRSLIRTETAARGLSIGVKDDDFLDNEDFREHVYDEEDMFIHERVTAVHSLPSFLLSGCKAWKTSSLPLWHVAEYRKTKMLSEYLDFFRSMVYVGDSKSRFRYDALDRGCDATESVRHSVLFFLDYLSIIRCCVVSDKANVDHRIERHGLRSGRCRRRQAFLEGIIPPFARQGDNLARFNDITVELHENALHVCHCIHSV